MSVAYELAAAPTAPAYTYVCDVDSPEWLDLRKTGLGASDAHRALTSPLSLYLEKRGEIESEQLDGEWIKWGHKLEGIIVAELGLQIGAPTQRVGRMYRSTSEPWMLASLDGIVLSPDGRWIAPVEAKNVGAWNAHEWEEGAPRKFWEQNQQQMYVMGLDHGYIPCLIGGNRFAFERVERDDKWLAAYIKQGRDLWRRIQEGDRPAVDGSPATIRALKALHPNDNGETVALPGSLISIDTELADLKKQAKVIESEVKKREALIMEAIGNATFGALANGTTYSWKTHHKKGHTVAASDYRTLLRKASKEAA